MKNKTAQKILNKVVRDYEKISKEFAVTRQKGWEEFDKFLDYIKENDQVVDIGCGNGRFCKYLSTKIKTNYIGIDNNQKLLEIANQENDAKFILGDFLKIPLKDENTDVAVAIASLHHIPSNTLRKEALIEINRILKNDGYFIVSVWDLFQSKYKKYIWKARLKNILTLGKFDARDCLIPWGNKEVYRYYYAFKPKELKNLLKKAGFEILFEQKNKNIVFICQKTKSKFSESKLEKQPSLKRNI